MAFVVKRRHSASEVNGTPVQVASLRDSAIDLISDDENSEAYTAVSLAGENRERKSLKCRVAAIRSISEDHALAR